MLPLAREMGMQQGCPVAVKEREGGADPVLLREAEGTGTIDSVLAHRFRWVSMTPFFAPVLPEVKMTTATSSSLTAGLSYFFAGVGAGR